VPRAEDLEYIWGLIDKHSAAASELRVRESDEYQIAGQSVIFAVDNGQNRLLLIPIAPDARIQEDRRSAGVQTTLRVLIDGSVRRSFLAVMCLKPHLNSLFSIIAAEIIERLQVDASSPDVKAHQVLNRWRELLERAPSYLPSREVLIGAFGELYVLRQLVQHVPSALRFWDGSDRARHDFLARSAALEVKTTTDRNRLCVTIRGHDQLEPPLGSALYLALIRLERVRTGGESLFDIVETIADMGADRVQLLTQLAKLDITHDVLVQLKEDRYVVRDEFIYKIDEDFPKITSASFAGGRLPERISAVTYQIDLSTQPPYPLSADEVQDLLRRFALEALT
jgi:hypothetical protein